MQRNGYVAFPLPCRRGRESKPARSEKGGKLRTERVWGKKEPRRVGEKKKASVDLGKENAPQRKKKKETWATLKERKGCHSLRLGWSALIEKGKNVTDKRQEKKDRSQSSRRGRPNDADVEKKKEKRPFGILVKKAGGYGRKKE